MRALVVEDDLTMASLTKQVLEQEGFAVDHAETASDGQALALSNDYDAIVLDLTLPDGHGVTILQAIRLAKRSTPVLVLTGTKDSATTVRALDAGADDYVTKPIIIDEFRARIRALLRRGGASRTEQLAAGNLVLNRLTRQVYVDGKVCTLTAKELQLLEHFLLRHGEVVSRTDLLDKVWDMHFDPGSNVVDVHVARLRKKLDAAGAQLKITARRGMGFVLSNNT